MRHLNFNIFVNPPSYFIIRIYLMIFLFFATTLQLLSPCYSQVNLKSGNPIFTEWYADPEIVILDNEYWIFPTFSGISKNQDFLDAFSSKDLREWTKHGNIVTPKNVNWVKNALWAPSAIEKDGKFFLFFSANDIQTSQSPWWNPQKHDSTEVGGIGIAIANEPEGPYSDYLGKPLINKVYNGAQPIDQYVFKDKDDNYYMIYGGWKHCNIGKLNNKFTDFIKFDNGELFKEITPQNYVEGPVMFLRKNTYYLMWSEGSWGNDTYKVAYGMATSPFGPFNRIQTILESDNEIATGAGHNSVLQIPGTDNWYIVYHRRPLANEHKNHRVICIDKMTFDNNGKIKPIKMTIEGVDILKINDN